MNLQNPHNDFSQNNSNWSTTYFEASDGFFRTVFVLLISLAVSEVVCYFVFQCMSYIVYQTQSFYSDYQWLGSFMIEYTDEVIEQKPYRLDAEDLANALITTTVHKDQLRCVKALDQQQQCAICLCEFEPNESISRSKSCNHYFHTSCYKQWITRDKHHSCPYCRVDILNYRIPRSGSKRDLLNLSRSRHHNDIQPTGLETPNSLSRVNTSSNLLELTSSNMPSF